MPANIKLSSLITIVKSITKLAFRASSLSHSETTSLTFTRNNSFGENVTLSNLCNTKFLCLTSPPKQHQSFFRNRTLRTTPEICPDPTNLVLPSHRARSHWRAKKYVANFATTQLQLNDPTHSWTAQQSLLDTENDKTARTFPQLNAQTFPCTLGQVFFSFSENRRKLKCTSPDGIEWFIKWILLSYL